MTVNDGAPQEPGCCAEFGQVTRLGRRGFLAGLAAGTGALVTGQLFGDAMLEATFAAGPTANDNVLVVLSLRGGIDGMGLVVPHGDPGYYAARPTIALPKAALLGTDSMFGLHPQLAPLLPMWNAGHLAAVHAVGMTTPNRSHFEAMQIVEEADPGSAVRRGWVNRMIGMDGLTAPAEAMHLSSGLVPTMLDGPEPTLGISDLDDLALAGHEYRAPDRYSAFDQVWDDVPGELGAAARSAKRVSTQLAPQLAGKYTPSNGVKYPTQWPGVDLGKALQRAAQLVKADVGTRVISIDFGSWDMHSGYGTAEWGAMQSMTSGLAANLAAFFADLGALGQKVTLVTISEFGRRLSQNGSGGLDHGWGNVMLALGAGVKGGRYYGRWPGLGSGALLAGDLQVTTDYRNVLGEVVATRFPERSVAGVFPGLSYAPLGLMS